MFEYKLPFLKKEITVKQLSIFFTVAYILSVIPMLIMGFYAFPSADDFSMAFEPHQYFVATGNVFGTIGAAFAKTLKIWLGYEGYFFSALLTCLSPAVYGEGFYALTPFLMLGMMTFGVCYFFRALFVKVFKADKHLANTVSMMTLIMMTQFIKESSTMNEAFYWYSGAINYTFTFGMAFFWFGLLIRCVYDEDAKKRRRMFIWACIWGFCLGGANYMTALELAMCSFFLIVIILLAGKKIVTLYNADDRMTRSLKLLAVPAALNIIGFGFSCFAPGIKFRQAEITDSYPPVKAVLISLYSTFNVIIDGMMRWETVVFLLILAIVFWKMGAGIKYRFRHPFVFTVFAYGMVSSNQTPVYFATANLDSGRIRALTWMEFVFFAVLTVFYVTVWLRQYLEENKGFKSEDKESAYSNMSSSLIAALLLIFVFGSGLCIMADQERYYYTSTACIRDLVTGEAAGYREENMERLRLLKDPSVEPVIVKEHEYDPKVLVYLDVDHYEPTPVELRDPDDPDADGISWINGVTAEYYGHKKLNVELIEREQDEE